MSRLRLVTPLVLLSCLLFATYGYFYPASQHNSAARYAQMRSLWEKHTLSVDDYYYMSGDLITYDFGGVRAKNPLSSMRASIVSCTRPARASAPASSTSSPV